MINREVGLIPFHSNELVTFKDERDGEIYVAMKPIVTGMGLDWAGQFTKIKENPLYCDTSIELESNVGTRNYICLPKSQLPRWLYSINPNKVKPEIADQIILYQDETAMAIDNYWNKGMAIKTAPSNAVAFLQMAQLMVDQEQRLTQIESNAVKVESDVGEMKAVREQAEEDLQELEISDEPAKQMTTRAKINQLVRTFSSSRGTAVGMVWTKLYRGLYYRYSFDVKKRAKNLAEKTGKSVKKINLLDIIDEEGLLSKLFSLATELLTDNVVTVS